jgi:anti-sigma B factor antagonist
MSANDGAECWPEIPLDIAWHTCGAVVWVSVIGDVDMDNADRLTHELTAALRATDQRVVIDMAAVGFFGSAGVRALTEQRAAAAAIGCQIELHRLPPIVRRVLEISGVLELFQVTGVPVDSSSDG